MWSLASMTGTGDLSGGDTLAGGGGRGAAEGGNRMFGLLLSATAGAPRALPARCCVSVSVDMYAVKCRRRTCLVDDSDFFIIACRGIRSGRYYARCISLASLARKGLLSGGACRHCADSCKHYISACKIHEYSMIYTFNSRTLALNSESGHLLLAIVFRAPCRNFFERFATGIPGIFRTLGIAAVTTQRIHFFLKRFFPCG